jgi:hypothetical protein
MLQFFRSSIEKISCEDRFNLLSSLSKVASQARRRNWSSQIRTIGYCLKIDFPSNVYFASADARSSS